MDCKNVFVSCGELSGEMHLAGLVRQMKRLDPRLCFTGIGSGLLKKAGCSLLMDYRQISLIGIWEVVKKYFFIRRKLRMIKEYLRTHPVSLMILTDFPGFHFIIARYAKELGIRTVYFIPPQIWAWHYGRVKKIREYFDLVLPILPFEEKIYRKEGIPCVYAGHPLLDSIPQVLDRKSFLKRFCIPSRLRIIALLPGSREMEIVNNLPVMLQTARELEKRHKDLFFVLNRAGSVDLSLVQRIIKQYPVKNFLLLEGHGHSLLKNSMAAMAVSGTVTLEAAWLGCPMAVIYRVNPLTCLIFRMLARVKYIALPNLIAGKRVVRELVQSDLTVENLLEETDRLISDRAYRQRMIRDLSKVRAALGKKGVTRSLARRILRPTPAG